LLLVINAAEQINMLLNGVSLKHVEKKGSITISVTDQMVCLSEQCLLFLSFQELEFTNMQQVLTVMHAFYAAKVAQVDPNFSFDNSF